MTAVPPWAVSLREALADPTRSAAGVADRPGRGGRPSAVLVLLAGSEPAAVRIVLVERGATLRHHAGQIALPGGAADAGDLDPAATALREAHEETGLQPHDVEVLGALAPAHVAVSGFDVTAVVGWWARPHPLSVQDPGEIAAVHVVDVAELLDPAHRVSVQHPSGYRGPAFSITSTGDEAQELFVWGLTAHLLAAVFDLAGWTRPWDDAVVAPIPERFGRGSHTGVRRGPDGH